MSDGQKKSETAKREEEVLAFWNEQEVFEKSLEKPSPKGEFVFYDGPPFATGLPHHGHLLGSTSKDLFGRYRTMRGYHVRRRWGWDTHGLPIESLVEKKLGLKTKKDILDIGVEKFNQEARSMVLDYVSEWKRYVERLGRWVDFENSYKTMDATYTESVWWALKEIHKKGHLYEGYKVLMYCPHCETPLAKAEIAMDNTYKDVVDEAVTIRFRLLNPEKLSLKKPAFMLAWTTTPWTLPANTALAVGEDINYAIIEKEEEYLILAKELAEKYELSLDGAQFKKGSELTGLLYDPLYKIEKAKKHNGKRWQVFTGDFVSVEDGTGIVHTGTIYGEEDYDLVQQENLPFLQLLGTDGTFNKEAPEFIQGTYFKKGGKLVTEDLESRGLLFKKEQYQHSYPHCYRCDTALIYNAVSSWFINVQVVKDSLLKENEKINWVPNHLKEGRFKNILENAPDWTISRNRFWASPLPIWKDKNGNVRVIGSREELKERTKKSGNRYILMRHGQAQSNAKNTASTRPDAPNGLTELGKEQAQHTAHTLKDKNIDVLITTPVLRAQETAEIVADTIGYSKGDIVVDPRMSEIQIGVLEGKSTREFHGFFDNSYKTMFEKRPEGGENLGDLKRRVGEFLYECEEKYQDKTILVVAHEYSIWMAEAIAAGADVAATVAMKEPRPEYYETGEAKAFDFVPLPHNEVYELDYHLPYIDRVQLEDENGEPLKRIPEVVDCWIESGSMPFAEYNYPFNNKREFESRSPGEFISEYIAQTRTWFYYMHVLSVHLFGHRAFNNVVTTGTILAADGNKMSKSKNNFTPPDALIDQFGSDAFRFYLMSSVLMQAEDFNFNDNDLRDTHNKVVNILRNTKSFFVLYKDGAPPASNESNHVLDRWILLRLEEVITETTKYFDVFDTPRASRMIREFIDDFSTWYVRRSRDRVKEGGEDGERALATLRFTLREFSKVIAPVMPFIADEIYREVRADDEPISVHLSDWPEAKEEGFLQSVTGIFKTKKDEPELFGDMREVRELVSLALEARQNASIKVRQPLSKLTVNSSRLLNKNDLLGLMKDELNVKEVIVQTGSEERVVLDTEITPELKEEGEVRDLMREIQDLRKKAGLSPQDKATLYFAGDTNLLEKHWEEISKVAGLVRFEKGEESYVKGA